MEDRYGISIAAEFVRQLLKTSSIQYRISRAERKGPVDGFEPRPHRDGLLLPYEAWMQLFA
jgi:hypothetical protein